MFRRIVQIRFLSWLSRNFDMDNPLIREKRDHTMFVCDAIKMISKQEKLSDEEYDIAMLTGLLHDVGRFPQLTKTGSFKDTPKFDHAKYGAQMLKNGLLKELLPETRLLDRQLIEVVESHSAPKLPKSMDPITRLYSEILRDADRLDLLRACIDEFDVLFWNGNGKSSLSPRVREEYILRSPISVSECETNLDLLALRVGLIYHYTFKGTLVYLKENKMLEELKNKFDMILGKFYEPNDVNLLFNTAEYYLKISA